MLRKYEAIAMQRAIGAGSTYLQCHCVPSGQRCPEISETGKRRGKMAIVTAKGVRGYYSTNAKSERLSVWLQLTSPAAA